MFVVFDLDGTLADASHREHYVRRPVGQKDWDAFHAAAVDDPTNHEIVEVLLMLDTHHNVQIWTGRDESHRDQTVKWLGRNLIPFDRLVMRPSGDKTEDHILKRQWANKYGHPDLVFEDRQRVVDMWRSIGVTCCQVAPGDF